MISVDGSGSAVQMAAAGTDPFAAVRRFNQAFDAQDVDAVMSAMTDDCRFEDTSPPDGHRHVGPARVRAAWEELFASTPPGAFTTEDMFAAGDRVVVRWRYSWGDGHVRGVDVFTVRDGLVAEKLAYVKG
jgi:ketosteroid isomerase-like protein